MEWWDAIVGIAKEQPKLVPGFVAVGVALWGLLGIRLRRLRRRVAAVEARLETVDDIAVTVRAMSERLNDFFALLRDAINRAQDGAVMAVARVGAGLVTPTGEAQTREWEREARPKDPSGG